MKRPICVLLLICFFTTQTAFAQSVTARVSIEDASTALTNNIDRAAQSLDGVHIAQGGRFSFNELVGPRTAQNGYDIAPNGRGAEVTGGGAAIVASAVDLALQAAGADIEYRERRTYGTRYNQKYVDDSEDAILVDHASGIDYCFINLGEALTLTFRRSQTDLWCDLEIGAEEATPELPDLRFEADADSLTLAAHAEFALRGEDELQSNVRIAANKLDDCVLESGESFSFNGLVGPRTSENGFKSAVNGRGVKVVGGGVAQCASVIFLAVKQLSDIAVTQKETYGSRYNQSYVSSSNDAILTDYTAGVDFAFRNTGEDTLTLNVYVEDGKLCCDVYQS